MTEIDKERFVRLYDEMERRDVDVLVCRLPENVLYISNYWAQQGLSLAVLPKNEKPILLAPEVERPYAEKSWADTRIFGWGLVGEDDLFSSFSKLLTEVRDEHSLQKATVGIESSFELVAPPYNVMEPVGVGQPTINLIEEVFSEGQLTDATGLLEKARSVKTDFEQKKLRIANEIAALGLARFEEEVSPGKTEAQIAAAVEQEIRSKGAGYKGANFARGSAEIRTGPGSFEALLFVPSRNERVEEGDLVLLELPTVVDGYWSDLTRVTVAGRASDKQKEVYELVKKAQQAAIDKIQPGTKCGEVDKAARETIEDGGYGDNFPHITGHGLGLRYHENIPLLFPGAEEKLEQGMVTSVEPGIYIKDWGGIRIEDNVLVTKDGSELLSSYDRSL